MTEERKTLHLVTTRPSGAAQVRLVGRSWPRQQRTLRELLRQPGSRAALHVRPYEAMDRRHYSGPFQGEERRKKPI